MADHVEVRRTGGFIGRPVTGRVSLDPAIAGHDEAAAEVQALVARLPFEPVVPGRRHPDMFTFTFVVGEQAVTYAEGQLTPDLQRLAELVLAFEA